MKVDNVSTSAVSQDSQNDLVQNKFGDNRINTGEKNTSGKIDNEKQQAQMINEEEFIKTIEAANDSIRVYNTRLKFSIHEQTKEIMVKVINTKTDKVIREIPPEKILDLVAKLWELAGIIVDEKV